MHELYREWDVAEKDCSVAKEPNWESAEFDSIFTSSADLLCDLNQSI